MAVTKSILKLTETDCVIKVAGSDDATTISLIDDLTRTATEVASQNGQNVVITTLTWSGDFNSLISIERAGTRVYTLQGTSSAQLDLNGQFTVPDNTEASADIYVNITGQGELVLRLQKLSGYDLKIETGLYGQYDDPTTIGPLNIPGSPGPAAMPRDILPVPGSGQYNFIMNTTNDAVGTPYEDTSYYWDAPPPNMTPGLYRRAFVGNFTDSPGSTIDTNFCRTNTGWYGEADPYVGFGYQDLENASNYTFEWTGWFRAPKTGTYNFWIQSDDVAYMWMNYPAMENQNADGNHIVMSNNSLGQIQNSLNMTEGNWYPVRIQFGEWGGAEQCQVYWATTDDPVAYAGYDNGESGYQVWYHNSETKGI